MPTARSELADRLAEALSGVAPPGLTSAYLFGSQARQQPHRESDIDVAVLFDARVHRTAKERFEAGLVLSSRLQAGLGTPRLDLVVLNDAPPGLARRIVTTGGRLMCADASADLAFVRDAQIRAADIEPFLRRTRQVKLAALAR